MSLVAVPDPDYRGGEGVQQIHGLRRELVDALRAGDWPRVRELDRACAGLVDRVVAANSGEARALAEALTELKRVYAELLDSCHHEVARLAL